MLQSFAGPRARRQIIERFSALPLLVPDREDHFEEAEVRNRCRRAGVQIGTIDALLAQICIRYELTLLWVRNPIVHPIQASSTFSLEHHEIDRNREGDRGPIEAGVVGGPDRERVGVAHRCAVRHTT